MDKLKNNIAISESGFIFNPETGDSYTVNPIGLEIIKFLKEGKEYEEILELMILQYDIPASSFERYYMDFIRSLRSENFLEK